MRSKKKLGKIIKYMPLLPIIVSILFLALQIKKIHGTKTNLPRNEYLKFQEFDGGKTLGTKENPLNILEIEPSNDFTLTDTSLKNLIPGLAGKHINIAYQTTSEFIGLDEDLIESYDLIYIGTNTGNMNTRDGSTVYNDPLLDGLVYIHVGDRLIAHNAFQGALGSNNGRIVKAKDSINTKGNLAENQASIFKGYEGYSWPGMENWVDFYRFSGNDITGIKRDDLQEFIDGGYPVLLEGNLYKGNKANSNIVDDSSHLYKLLNGNIGKDNVFNKNNLSSDNSKLLNYIEMEKLSIELIGSPKEFKVDDKATLITDRRLDYTFKINTLSGSGSDHVFQWDIYVDMDADGRYTGKEIVSSGISKANLDVTVSKQLSKEYAGVIPWKLEVKKQSNSKIRTSKTGYAAFVARAEKEIINVLQITSDESTVNLEKSVNDVYSNFYRYTKDLDDFNVKIKTINVTEFLNWYKGVGNNYTFELHDERDKFKFEKDGVMITYDMLIFGFGDSYTDINNDNGALNNIQSYIDSGRSVMFSHDTTSFVNTDKTEFDRLDTRGQVVYFGHGFNSYLRNRVGMDRYGLLAISGDTARYDLASMPSKAKNSGIYKNNATTYPEIQGYTYGALLSFFNTHIYDKDFAPNGKILWANREYPPFRHGNPFGSDWDIPNGVHIDYYFTNSATKVNEGQITSYPYKIPDKIDIATTHTQWNELNMEDDEIVVWFALSDDKKGNGPYSSSPNDVRNNYYLYSKGNIMYTGLGHSGFDEGKVDEIKLFINAMIAAYKAGISAPEIEITNPDVFMNNEDEYSLYVDEGEDTRKVYFSSTDRNLLTKDLVASVYYYDKDGNLIYSDLVIRSVDGTDPTPYWKDGKINGYNIIGGEEYYFEFPLSNDKDYKRDQVYISVTNAGGLEDSEKVTFQVRNLFDLF